jgi:hypothetical protein
MAVEPNPFLSAFLPLIAMKVFGPAISAGLFFYGLGDGAASSGWG